jgi:hypothetical protein
VEFNKVWTQEDFAQAKAEGAIIHFDFDLGVASAVASASDAKLIFAIRNEFEFNQFKRPSIRALLANHSNWEIVDTDGKVLLSSGDTID